MPGQTTLWGQSLVHGWIPSDWPGVGAHGSLLFRDTGASDGASWVTREDLTGCVNVQDPLFGSIDLTGAIDCLTVLQAAIAATPSGGVLIVPPGTYGVSNTLACPRPITILGMGTAAGRPTKINPLASFPAGADVITITGGYSTVSGIASEMNRRGGNWLTFIGEGGNNFVERNYVSGVSAGYWGIELRDSGGANGIALTHIEQNVFSDFDGGAIWGNGGGDSCSIWRNVFQLVASTSHIIKWSGPAGAAKLSIWANNATGAAKFIELNTATQFSIIGNQFEATTALTSTERAMIVVNGPAQGWSIRDNNLNGTALNALVAIYLDDAQYGVIDNNTISGVTTNILTTASTSHINVFDAGLIGLGGLPTSSASLTVPDRAYFGATPPSGVAWLPPTVTMGPIAASVTAPTTGTGSALALAGRYRSSDNAQVAYGDVAGVKENATDANLDGALDFYVSNNAAGATVKRLRITSVGDVKVLTSGKGVVLINAAGTVTKRVRLNDAGDGLIFEAE